MNPNNRLTTNQGAPVGDNQNSRTAGRRECSIIRRLSFSRKTCAL